MANPFHLALVPYRVPLELPELTSVASALSKQIARDFGPIWQVSATVDAFPSLDRVPLGYWPIIVLPQVQDAAGYHQDRNRQPYAVVQFGSDWSLTASHECLEMLADPWGNNVQLADTLPQALKLGYPQHRLSYLVEVCDPCEEGTFAYTINDDKVVVSDFYTPRYFDPVISSGVRYDFAGALSEPRQVLSGGYISWQDTVDRNWYQLRMFPDQMSRDIPHIVNLSQQAEFAEMLPTHSIRAIIDHLTPNPPLQNGLDNARNLAARGSVDESCSARRSRAEELAADLDRIIGDGGA